MEPGRVVPVKVFGGPWNDRGDRPRARGAEEADGFSGVVVAGVSSRRGQALGHRSRRAVTARAEAESLGEWEEEERKRRAAARYNFTGMEQPRWGQRTGSEAWNLGFAVRI